MGRLTEIRARMLGRAPVSADVAAFVALATLISTAVWLHLDHLSVLIVGGALAALALAPHLPVPAAVDAQPVPALTRAGLLRSLPIAALIALPMMIELVATLHEEFPFSGDHLHHLLTGQAVRAFWMKHIPSVIAFAWIPYLLRRRGVRYWAALSFAALIVWSYFGMAPTSAARYPASSYLLEVPLRFLAHGSFLDDPAIALDRISTAMSVLVWLFVLRPLVLRRWPDVGLLPFALFFFWQKETVFYMTSVYLEPWAIVLLLVALELMLSDLPYRTWLPPILVGAAAGFKEQAILVLPFVGLATLASLPRTARAWGAAALNGFVAMLPFLVYYQFRKDSSVLRAFGMGTWRELWSASRFDTLAARAQVEFGTGGLVLLALSVVVLVVLAWRDRARRWPASCLLGAVVAQFLFFYVDRASMPYTGYSRFYLVGLAILGVVAWLPGPAQRADRRFGRVAAAAAVVIGLLQAPALGSYLAMFARPDPARNFMEHTDSSIYFPIRSLVEEAEDSGALALDAPIAVQPPGLAIPPIDQFYALGRRHVMPFAPSDCRCAPDRTALLLPITYPTGLLSEPGELPLPAETTACIDAMRATYQRVFERAIDGYPTGLLGVGCKTSAK